MVSFLRNWLKTICKFYSEAFRRLSSDCCISSANCKTKQYGDSGKENFINTFTSLRNEFRLLTVTHQYLRNVLMDYKSLHREKWSGLLSIMGKAMNFLFGTLTDEDISSIKNNIKVLSENQNKISHVSSENLSILNVTSTEASENRQAINSLIGDLREIDDKFENITQDIEKQLIELGHFVQLYVQLDLITGELKLWIQKAMSYFGTIEFTIKYVVVS